jgi:hypothetical protein
MDARIQLETDPRRWVMAPIEQATVAAKNSRIARSNLSYAHAKSGSPRCASRTVPAMEMETAMVVKTAMVM